MILPTSAIQVLSGRPLSRKRPANCTIWLGLLLALSLTLAGPTQATDLEEVTAASDKMHSTVRKALAEEDGDLLASVFTEDGAVISPNGRVVSGQLTLKTSATLLFMTMGGGSIEISRQSLSLIDGTAYESGRYIFKRSDDETNQSWQGLYVAIWQREEGKWKVSRALGLR